MLFFPLSSCALSKHQTKHYRHFSVFSIRPPEFQHFSRFERRVTAQNDRKGRCEKKVAWTWFILVAPIELYIIYENESCSAFDLSFLIQGCFVHYDHHSSLLLLINLK